MAGIPLYLQDIEVQRLDLDSANRLCIDLENRPQRKIPLRYVSRVICRNGIDISTRALVACMKKGIPVSILDRTGETLGWCMGVLRKENTLRNLLTHALDDSEWEGLYSEWFSNQILSMTAHALVLCGIPVNASARANPRPYLCNLHRQKHGVSCGKMVTVIAQLAQQELAARLYVETGEPELLTMTRPGLNLITDLGEILGLHAHTDVQHTRRLPEKGKLGAWGTSCFEFNSKHWNERINSLIFSFEQFLRKNWL